MKKIFSILIVFVLTLFVSATSALAMGDLVWDQGFEFNADGWLDVDDSWYGQVTWVPSDSDGLSSFEGSYHAIFEGDASSAPFSRFDGYRDTWMGTWTAEIAVYLDPAWENGEGFDYSVAANGSDGAHQRDYIFHVGTVEDYGDLTGKHLLVNGSNNADFSTNPYKLLNDNGGNYYEVSDAGWYTLQHKFYDAGGYLAVDLNLLDDEGNVLWTATRSNTADTIPGEVGGNRYAWFTHINVSDGIAVDNHQLMVTPPRSAEITSPTEGQKVSGVVSFEATLTDDDYDDEVQWAVRQGTCAAGVGTVFGNVDGYSDPFTWVNNMFTAEADTSSWIPGDYCFIFNPTESNGDDAIRETREFVLADTTAPLVSIESPMDRDVVNGTVDIFGTVQEDYELSHYNIAVYPGDADYNDFSQRIAQETVYRSDSFNNENLFTWDSTSVEDGEYLFRLAARDAALNRDLSGDPTLGGDDSQHVIKVIVNNTPDTKDDCKKGGWENWLVPEFKNQGECVSYLMSNSNAGKRN